MEKKIRSELLKMTAIMLLLIGLGIYAHDFVIAGIKAKAALNLTIFGLAGIAASIAFRHVLALRNEVLALKALQIDYGKRNLRPQDPYASPAILFDEPELLGNGYNLIAEEMGKNENFQISNATVQAILHDIDARINDRKSTLMYFSGLMVFLGLLGAFMGLMKTVHSVSDLIGSMDMSPGAGADSFGKMIDGMKAPLNGMSVGFSSSLFGLMTSMVLGALERFMTSAMKALRNEFEHWLANVSALEAPQGEATQRDSADMTDVIHALQIGSKQLGALRETVLDSAFGQQQTQAAVAQMNHAVAQLARTADRISDPTPLFKPISDCVAELAQNQMLMVSQFQCLIDEAQRDRSHIQQTLGEVRTLFAHNAALSGPRLHTQLDRIVGLQRELLEREPSSVSTAHYQRGGSGSGGLLSRLAAFLLSSEATLGARRERKHLRQDVRRVIASQRGLSRKVERTFGDSLRRLEQGRAEDGNAVARLLAQNEANQARLDVLMHHLALLDEDVSDGDRSVVSGLHGARLEMEVLKTRLNAIQDRRNGPERGTGDSEAGEVASRIGNG